jgi:phage anti-repressor protein
LIEKVKNSFTDYEQHIFLTSFYCYLNYDYKNDFVVDLDDIWKWLGFGQKVNVKRLLEKHFIIDKDYKLLLCQLAKQTNDTRGGHNKETFLLNIETFKKLCLKTETKKADEIHDYFIKLEHILQEILLEESNELKLQLEQQQTEFALLEYKQK